MSLRMDSKDLGLPKITENTLLRIACYWNVMTWKKVRELFETKPETFYKWIGSRGIKDVWTAAKNSKTAENKKYLL